MKYILIIIFVLITGCSSLIKSSADIANVTSLAVQINSGQIKQAITSIELGSTELQIINHSNNQYIAFIDKWKHRATTLDSNSSDFEEFLLDYNKLVDSYKSVENIVNSNWSLYPEHTKALLTHYQIKANKANNTVDKMIIAGKTHQALLDALFLAKVLAGVLIR